MYVMQSAALNKYIYLIKKIVVVKSPESVL
jgi:hypothetical protein